MIQNFKQIKATSELAWQINVWYFYVPFNETIDNIDHYL